MAELNWIPKEERLPTAEDANDRGDVYGCSNGNVRMIGYQHMGDSFTHWLPFSEMPVPKRWRVPTIHDLAKAGKPIPCRARKAKFDWENLFLVSIIMVDNYEFPFLCKRPLDSVDLGFRGYEFCEICDD